MSDLTDMINEALSDAICNGDGRPAARHLLVELEHRGLAIVPIEPGEAMVKAGLCHSAYSPREIYRAMLSIARTAA